MERLKVSIKSIRKYITAGKRENETEAERTNRLERRRQKQQQKKDDEQDKLLEILRGIFPRAIANEKEQPDGLAKNETERDKGKTSLADAMNASLLVSKTTEECVPLYEANGLVSSPIYEADEQLNNIMSVDQNELKDTSVPEADEELGMSLPEAEGPGVTKKKYLHEGGW